MKKKKKRWNPRLNGTFSMSDRMNRMIKCFPWNACILMLSLLLKCFTTFTWNLYKAVEILSPKLSHHRMLYVCIKHKDGCLAGKYLPLFRDENFSCFHFWCPQRNFNRFSNTSTAVLLLTKMGHKQCTQLSLTLAIFNCLGQSHLSSNIIKLII